MIQPLLYNDGSPLSELDRKLVESYFHFNPTKVGVDSIRGVDDITRLRDKLEGQAKAEPEDTTITKLRDELYGIVAQMDLFLVASKCGMARAMDIDGTYRRVRIFNTDEALFIKSAETRMRGEFETETDWVPDFKILSNVRGIMEECVREYELEAGRREHRR